jgi:phosphoglycolate phosphatase
MPKLFIDLDGTILDSRKRVYEVFQFLNKQSDLSFNSYWEIKREGVSHENILLNRFNFSETEVRNFTSKWMKEIELEKWLNLDLPFPNVIHTLEKFKTKHQLILVTARQKADLTIEQLKKNQLHQFFFDVLITNQTKSKKELINSKFETNKNDVIIGDTGKDIETGKDLGIRTVAVLSGFLSANALSKYQPDIIIPSINELDI